MGKLNTKESISNLSKISDILKFDFNDKNLIGCYIKYESRKFSPHHTLNYAIYRRAFGFIKDGRLKIKLCMSGHFNTDCKSYQIYPWRYNKDYDVNIDIANIQIIKKDEYDFMRKILYNKKPDW